MLRKQLVVIALIGMLVALYFAFDLGQYFNLQTLKVQQAAIEAYRSGNPGLTAAIYFTLYVVITALSLPGAALMTLAGGAIFGLVWGTLLVSFASSAGATLAFLTARFLLRDWVTQRFGQRLQSIDDGVRREGAFYLFTVRLVPVFPFFLVNLLLGCCRMSITARRARPLTALPAQDWRDPDPTGPTQQALQSDGRRCNILWKQCSAAH